VENEKKFSGEGQLNLFEEMGSSKCFIPEKTDEMDEDTKLMLEKEVTGIYISGHPMSRYSAFSSKAGFAKTTDIYSGKYSDGERVTLAGIIDNFKVRQLKNNKLMATCKIEDIYSAVNVTIFEAVYVNFKNLLTSGKPVIIKGRISEREDRDIEIVCSSVESFPENADKMTASKKMTEGLYIKVNDINSPDFNLVKQILSQYKGNTAVYIISSGKKFEAPKSLYVKPEKELFSKLFDILGEENIKLVD